MLNLNQVKEHYSQGMIDLVNSHFERLSDSFRMPIFLLIQANFTVNEVSGILELPVDSIQTKIYLGLNKIKYSLSSEGVIASLDLIWNILGIIEKVKLPDYVGGLNYFQSIYVKHSSLNESFQQMASPLSNTAFQTNS